MGEKGKKWLEKARLRLQKAIEDELKANGRIELDSKRFKSFAFGTHVDAYWNAGLSSLPLTDLRRIVLTPDLKEWGDSESRQQAYDIAGRLFEVWREKAETVLQQQSDEVANYLRKILK
jgi:hypothetical protein